LRQVFGVFGMGGAAFCRPSRSGWSTHRTLSTSLGREMNWATDQKIEDLILKDLVKKDEALFFIDLHLLFFEASKLHGRKCYYDDPEREDGV
jgi:hypothetical protein